MKKILSVIFLAGIFLGGGVLAAQDLASGFIYNKTQVSYDSTNKVYYATGPNNSQISSETVSGIKSAIDRLGQQKTLAQESSGIYTDINHDSFGIHLISPKYDVKTKKVTFGYKMISNNPKAEYYIKLGYHSERNLNNLSTIQRIEQSQYIITHPGKTQYSVKDGGTVMVSTVFKGLMPNESICIGATAFNVEGGLAIGSDDICLPFSPVPEFYYFTKKDTKNPVINGRVTAWTSDEYELLVEYYGDNIAKKEISYGKRKGSQEFSIPLKFNVSPGQKYELRVFTRQKRPWQSSPIENSTEYVYLIPDKPTPTNLSVLCSNAITEGYKVNADRAYAIAKRISQYLPIRPEFLAAISAQETKLGRDMGGYAIGNCSPSIRSDRQDFYYICDKAPIPASKCRTMPMSYNCAVGQVQFIPSTYRSKMEATAASAKYIFGVTTAKYSPFNVCTNFVAAAKYLIALGANKKTEYAENLAACRYWAGPNSGIGSVCEYSTQMSPRRACFQKFAKNLKLTKDCYDDLYGWYGE